MDVNFTRCCAFLTLTHVPIFLIFLSVHPFSPPLWLALQRKRPSIVWTVHPQWTMKVDINMSYTCWWECHFYSNMIYFLISSCRETHFRQANVSFFWLKMFSPIILFFAHVLAQRFSYSDKDTMKCLHTHTCIPFIVCMCTPLSTLPVLTLSLISSMCIGLNNT